MSNAPKYNIKQKNFAAKDGAAGANEVILSFITKSYLESHDFNGVIIPHIIKIFGPESSEIIKCLTYEEKVYINSSDANPHIKAFSEKSVEEQIASLQNPERLCIYPAKKHLEKILSQEKYDKTPYTKEVALGAGQLEFREFDLSVLEDYRNDPRYLFTCNDIGGRISISDYFFEDISVPEYDKISIQTFGFCYDYKKNRAVAVALRYLGKLPPEHQWNWYRKRKEEGGWKLHPDYHRVFFGTGWVPIKITIFEAFFEEIKIINGMTEIIGKGRLFNDEKKPKDFMFLIRPTLKEYNNFILNLDNLMSSNIKKSFFDNDLDFKDKEGKEKGTVTLLQEWLTTYYQSKNGSDLKYEIDKISKTFREIRNERSKPAHNNSENQIDETYIVQQRSVMVKAYEAIRNLRLIFSNHPSVRAENLSINEYLQDGKIWVE